MVATARPPTSPIVAPLMLGGFDPRSEKLFFRRRRGGAIALTLLVYAAIFGEAILAPAPEKTIEVELEPEIKDFAMEEEPVVEEEPPPPPPPNTKVEITKAPRPKPKIKTPIEKPQEAATESTQEKTVGHPGGPTAPGGTGEHAVEKPKTPSKPVEAPKPKVTPPPKPKKAEEPIDPNVPVDRPERATMPKPEAGNKTPNYPESLRDAGVTGEVVMKIHVHKDGSVRGAKILRKRSSAVTDEEKAEAEKLFVQAAIAAVKTWKYEPAKLDGEPISIWFPVTFPFSLTGG